MQAVWFAVQNLLFYKWWLPGSGEEAWILNLEPVSIGHDTGISQGVFLRTGSNDMASPTFAPPCNSTVTRFFIYQSRPPAFGMTHTEAGGNVSGQGAN
jgi:hypothetical protein